MIYFFFGLLTFDIFFLNRKIKVSISFLVCKMFLVGRFFCVCTMRTSETELILRTYIVTPTSTGGPATYIYTHTFDGFVCLHNT